MLIRTGKVEKKLEMHQYEISGLITITNNYLYIVADTDAIKDDITYIILLLNWDWQVYFSNTTPMFQAFPIPTIKIKFIYLKLVSDNLSLSV